MYIDSKVTQPYGCFRETLKEQSHHIISPGDMKTTFLLGLLTILHNFSEFSFLFFWRL